MLKFIVGDCPTESKAYVIHHANAACPTLPKLEDQVLIGYFANAQLAYKRARMNWPREQIKCCEHCCLQEEALGRAE